MNRLLIFIVAILCWNCGGKLTEEERKKLHEGMSTQDIKRIPEADIQDAALALGKSVFADVEKTDKSLRSRTKIDSICKARNVKIYTLIPDDKTLREIEKSLVDAYITGADAGQAVENLQKVGEDSLLYTKPVFKDRPDGSQQFSHAIGIKMAKRTIILSMPSL